MSEDKIAEIRARHSRDDHWRNSPSMISPQSHADRATLLAEIDRLRGALGLRDALRHAAEQDEIERLRAEIERLREALVLGSEVLASHQGSPQREWHSGGAWLFPGDSINVVRAPLPEIKVEP